MKNLIYCGLLIVHYLVLFVDVSTSGISTTSNIIVKQCMQDGGYCQNSWDCCSDRCLSFSYKCVARPSSAVNTQFSHQVEDPSVVSVATLEELVNRFGSDDDDKTLAKPTTTTTLSSTSPPTSSSTIHTNTSCIGIGYECADSSQCCSNDCLHYMDVHICIQKRQPISTTTSTPISTTTNGQCLQIGQKCYRPDECCTQRCHGFLHQCVT